jgi:kanamycin kinase
VRPPVPSVRACGLLHDRLPVTECPFGPPPWVVTDSMPVDRLVVCHGDACAPNTLVDDDGRCFGHVDLGDLGVADRWADLAVATLSLSWNYAGEWEDDLLDAYGVDPDPDRVEHYRRSPSRLWAQWNASDVSSH